LPSPRPSCAPPPFTIDGEAVVCGPDGIAIFDALHRHGTVSEAMLYAFDL
jgi:ATP-dependent DNA ligase